jgi:hypothetical protein
MDTTIMLILIVAPAIIVWGLAVADLMGRHESEFVSPSDKLCWTILLSITGILGAIVWLFARPRNQMGNIQTATFRSDSESSLTCLECGTPMREEDTQCPSCGWSYAAN